MWEITFQNLLEQLERKKPDLGAHIDTFNTFMGAAACLVGDSATGGVAALVNALAAKEKLFDLGKFLLDRLTGQKPDSYVGMADQMHTACGVLCFTAFFETLDSLLPEDLRRELCLTPQEKQRLFPLPQTETAPTSPLFAVPRTGGKRTGAKPEILLPFPDTVYGSSGMDRDLIWFYRSMADRLASFVEKLSFYDDASETVKERWRAALKQLPEAAVSRFHDQYLELCQTVPAFTIYIETEQRADFRAALESLPSRLKAGKVREIADRMRERYADDIARPVIEDPDGEESDDSLRYPPLDEAFVPQRYRLLRCTGQEWLEKTWEDTEVRENMMDFWGDYLLDPNSVEAPLLVLGDPGSGKSCLTKILCGRLWADSSVFVRIPLREYDLEDEIESIVCRQIVRDGDAEEPFHRLKWFAGEFSCPLTLLFDGYDEVMQATGGVYSNLLKRIQRFQDDCRENRRPVRVVVTSRETLIDKADIPNGTAVMKLLEFDGEQKKEWIAVWNRYNRDILSAEGLEEFSLPDEPNIQKLSGQPLLLLMLAIYDADFETRTNALRRSEETDSGLDRTGLYDRLLRRFIRRELRKGKRGGETAYEEASDSQRQSMEDEEMKKLGIAALGMFVREKLSLTVGELDGDLQTMKARLPVYGQGRGRTLKSAEALLGSFFFIHKPEGCGDVEESEREFEFLHKTFYEFLLADLVLQYYTGALEKLRLLKDLNPGGGPAYVDMLDTMDPDLAGAYYAALNGACLCVERETAEMIGEWAVCRRDRVFQGDAEAFKAVAEDLFWNHFRKIRDGLFRPAWMDGGLTGGWTFPQLCAVYLMNLVTLRILTCGEWDVLAEDWKYLALYLKLNLPAMKNGTEHEWNIEPSEEVILKFIELFNIGDWKLQCVYLVRLCQRSANNSHIYRPILLLIDLTYVKFWLATFFQDHITSKLFVLHGNLSNDKGVDLLYHDLLKMGMPLNKEYDFLRIHLAVLHPDKENRDGIYFPGQ